MDLDNRIREIKETKEYLENLLENANDIIFTLDLEGRFTYINQKIVDWGYDRGELSGKAYSFLLSEKHKGARFRKTVREGITQSFEVEAINKEGGIRYVVVSASPLKDQGGGIIGLLGIARDITDEKRMRHEMERSKRLSDLGEFSGGIAHEVRNPLARIMMGAYTLKEVAPDEGEKSRALDNILKGVVDLNRFVTELLNYTGRMELQRDKTDINKILDSTLFNLTEEAERNRVKITLKLDPELPKANVDGVKMDQAFSNIIRNAIQAMPDGGALTIITEYKPCPLDMQIGMKGKTNGFKPGLIKISLSDTGCGISEKDIDKIFNPFFTTRAEGIGLGLVLVHRIVEAHSGKIDVESREGEGSIFRILLPFVPDYQYHDEEGDGRSPEIGD